MNDIIIDLINASRKLLVGKTPDVSVAEQILSVVSKLLTDNTVATPLQSDSVKKSTKTSQQNEEESKKIAKEITDPAKNPIQNAVNEEMKRFKKVEESCNKLSRSLDDELEKLQQKHILSDLQKTPSNTSPTH